MLCVFGKGDSQRAATYLQQSKKRTATRAFGLAVLRSTLETLIVVAHETPYLSVAEGTTFAACIARTYAMRVVAYARVCEGGRHARPKRSRAELI